MDGGGSLKDWIPEDENQTGKLYEGGPQASLERILDISIQFARGLHYIHEHLDESGKPLVLIHQDVKPANLLLTPEGVAKVSDFGLARARQNSGGTLEATAGPHTREYCSKEQLYMQTLTRRTDI